MILRSGLSKVKHNHDGQTCLPLTKSLSNILFTTRHPWIDPCKVFFILLHGSQNPSIYSSQDLPQDLIYDGIRIRDFTEGNDPVRGGCFGGGHNFFPVQNLYLQSALNCCFANNAGRRQALAGVFHGGLPCYLDRLGHRPCTGDGVMTAERQLVGAGYFYCIVGLHTLQTITAAGQDDKNRVHPVDAYF